MLSNLETHRPGIVLVSDDHVLDAVSGGVDIGNAVTDTFLEVKWVGYLSSVLYGIYLYGNPTNRDKVVRICRQFANGLTQGSRDAIYLGITGAKGVAKWIKDYYNSVVGSNGATATQVCPNIP